MINQFKSITCLRNKKLQSVSISNKCYFIIYF